MASRQRFLLAVICFSGCFDSSQKESKLVVINVLDQKYYDDCHIKGSINIPFDEFENQLQKLDKKDSYVFYCSNYACTAAPFSAEIMKKAGFNQVYVYHGGIVEWYQKKYPYQGPAKLDYLQEENEQLDDEDNHNKLPVLTADELKAKMQKANLL
ncbi:MAG: hypothetical protein CL947_00210 [Epsilonproteobacteria bacterium]|nr:hypothetical protein [Campylobacterota bacterium]